MSARLVSSVALAVLLSAIQAAAQQPPAFRPNQIVVSGGLIAAGSYGVGDVTAALRRNSTTAASPFTLLVAESALGSAVGVEGRVAFALTPAFALEVGGSYAEPELGVTISQDVEAPAGAFASSGVEQYVVDISALYHLPFSIGRRTTTYLIGGGGYLRQLYDGRLTVETGNTIHLGGGAWFWLRSGPTRRPIGVRAEARYVRRSGGIEFADQGRAFPSVSVLGFFGF